MEGPALRSWLDRLETLHPVEIDLGLQRVTDVWCNLGKCLDNLTVVTVAGTNGKGSTTQACMQGLIAAGLNVGTYTSPHLLRYNERICINGKPVADDVIVDAFKQIDDARGDISLTYFEFGTLAALLCFALADLDVCILEVGLGGRLDAVNIIDADIAVITSIALDHEAWLGSDLASVAVEKAGIVKPGCKLVLGDLDTTLPGIISAAQRAAVVWQFDSDYQLVECAGEYTWSKGVVGFSLPSNTLNIPPNSLAIALTVIHEILGDACTVESYKAAGLARVAGRLQCLEVNGRQVLLDVAHNPAAVALLESLMLQRFPSKERPALVFAAMADKDIDSMLPILQRMSSRWLLPSLPDVPRALPAPQLSAKLSSHSDQDLDGELEIVVCESVASALNQELQRGATNPILVCGSFFTVAAALEYLQEKIGSSR